MRVASAVLGILLIGTLWLNVFATLVVPRGGVRMIKHVDRIVLAGYLKLSRPLRDLERREALLASEPVVVLGALLTFWLAGFVVAFALVGYATGGTAANALRESGSSLFTLGFTARSSAGPTVVDFFTAASGLVVVALQIAYLPTLYSAFNRRELEVTLLRPRAGSPAWGPEILARTQLAGSLEPLAELYTTWERWSADVAESHASYPSLLRFRSPDPYSSWVVAQLAVMDAAALHLAACPGGAPFSARMCLQMGFNSLRQLSRALRVSVVEDPRPDDALELSFDDFLQGWDRIVELGFPVERSAAEAWPHFRGWRVNYEAASYRLAYELDAVAARWSGPRRSGEETIAPRRFVNRTPEHPDGQRPQRRADSESRDAPPDHLDTAEQLPVGGSTGSGDGTGAGSTSAAEHGAAELRAP